ncbi:4-hydroxy-tetrahydrodipicolinate reductase [Amorphus sp. 3PC139-8]|uniref:4-hydroxy-tetrahydrodipicolinate reductase n=1 Tax=Amorphus sp. 3PC139-8 TaxID=2735676 RepID=UPI00345C6901
MDTMRLVVVGAAGRMGRVLIRAIIETPGAVVAGALERPGAPEIGEDAGALAGLAPLGVAVTDAPEAAFAAADGVIDFTIPGATIAFSEMAAKAGIVHVIGTTGLNASGDEQIAEAAKTIPVVKSGNMSLGVNLVAGLVEKAARALGPAFDIEILEMHHRRKIDAPSGTALLLGEAAAKGREVDLADHAVYAREGHTGARPDGAIGFATLRGGTVVGEHEVIFAGEGERVVLGHVAEDRSIFARGAVHAALWAHGREPGLYSMADVLGLND